MGQIADKCNDGSKQLLSKTDMARTPKAADTRLTITLSPFAFNQVTRLAKLMGSAPATLSARPVEDWVASPEFVELMKRAEAVASADDEGSDRA